VVPDAGFEFVVEESFTITGRGVAVVGNLVAGELASGVPGYVRLMGRADVAVQRIDVEWALSQGVERVALLLRDLSIDQVPAGCVVRSLHAEPDVTRLQSLRQVRMFVQADTEYARL